MKRPIIALVISIVLIFINLEANARVTWIIKLKTPPPGKLNTGDFWNITFTNNSESDLTGYISGIATEIKDGIIVKGTTVPNCLRREYTT